MTERADDIQVIDNPDLSRFEIYVGDERVGLAEYQRLTERMVFTHTEVNLDRQGQGLAGRLIRNGLDTAAERGLWVTPVCSYVADYIRRHPAYRSLVDDGSRAV
jgi:predicted GNAT family acetyltransferase